jgi:hypothetical protein
MKNKIFLCVLSALVWVGSAYAQQETKSPQPTSSLSNGTLQIIKVSSGFEAKRIRFNVDEKEMYYNIALSKWENK